MRPIAEGSRRPMVVCSRGPAARPKSGRGRLQGRNHRVYQRVSALLLPCPRLLPWGRVRGIGPLLVREPGQSDRPRARLLGLRPVLQRLQTRHFLSQGPGKVAVCTKCPNMPVAESGIRLGQRGRMALGHAVVNGQTWTNPDFAGALPETPDVTIP